MFAAKAGMVANIKKAKKLFLQNLWNMVLSPLVKSFVKIVQKAENWNRRTPPVALKRNNAMQASWPVFGFQKFIAVNQQ
jgi:hypothetical protein